MDSEGVIAHGGIVRSVSGGHAVIAVAAGGCGGCGRRSGCGIARLTSARGETLVQLPVDGLQLAPGMEITVEVTESSLLRAAVAGYLLPALLVLVCAVAGHLAGGDPGAAAGVLAGLGAGIAATRLISARNNLRIRGAAAPALTVAESR
jgi:positive regulator of sigma E activity